MRHHLRGRPVLVLGLGRSGTAAAHALLDAGAKVRIVDEGSNDAVARAASELDARGAAVRIGASLAAAGLLDGMELVVASPGVPPTAGVLQAAGERGIEVWSEPELAWRLCDGQVRIVGVTGTNGKTTTTELIAAALGVPAGGNIGTPLVTLLTTTPPPPLVVAELSSFQLHHCHSLRTDVGVLLNVADDHLDWHGSRAAYRHDKARIWRGQRSLATSPPQDLPPGGQDWAVVGIDDAGVREVMGEHPPPAGVLGFTTGAPRPGEVGVADGWVVTRADPTAASPRHTSARRVLRVQDLRVEGAHNLANVCAAVAAAQAAGAAVDQVGPALSGYRSGAHRLALVTQRDGVSFVDDSKATNPHAAAAAIASFPAVVWIAGGLAKGVDMAPLDPLLRDRVRAVVTIGTDGPVIAARARALGVPTVEAGDLATAVPAAAGLARAGDTVLLAPACASMDQFRDYAERGDAFAEHVRRWLGSADTTGRAASARDPLLDDAERTTAHGGA